MSQQPTTVRPVKAYSVQDGEHGAIVFATSGIAARRMGANELNTDFEAIESCRRVQWADEYASVGAVPPLVMIAHGWWFECSHCYRKVCDDSCHYDKESGQEIMHEPVADGDCIYCTPACRDAEIKERAEREAKKEAAKQTAEQQFPGVEVKWVDDSEPAKVSFTFPGGKYAVTWTVGDSFAMVPKIDTEAWEEFKAAKQSGGTS
ncbi:TPA: hypothetical protein P2N00_000509 [Aeromonas salmonicida]|uniref:Uncharacterized protein n=1 Tax=Aeromonas salmonicida subsp. salmonicida TaxID=29491 RepID=A0A0A7KTM5_AERSS|nr:MULTISPECIES: hypothetical protein [Aeromonas]AIZ49624.1 hypothetical protein [Aeromonas salmonicida subsp. salmonicida]OAH88277.1 hypothetical protein AXW79_01460 [Aeromonas salmonicida subsp. salmonicida]OKA78061.1 hypothetical protein BHR41_02505 [Aeromonas salmonicida subsp. salmonicida]SPT73614.1 Uncharacterised protein [Aeromonas salmonicida]HDN9784871.1 hypothetical protein [Aeromonas salmonicida]